MSLKIIFMVGILIMIDGITQLFLLLSQNKFHRRLALILLIYIVSSSMFLFQEVLYNDRALGFLSIISQLSNVGDGTLIKFSYEINFWSVIISEVLLSVIVIWLFRFLSKRLISNILSISVDKNADIIVIKTKGIETLRFTIKLSDFKQLVLFIILFNILVKLCIIYFWVYADKLSVMYLNIIIFIALYTVFLFICFYLFLDKYVKEFFVQNMFNDLEKHRMLHNIFKLYIKNNEVNLNFEDYNLDIKQAIELGIIIPIEKISYKDFKELGNIKIYINEESVKAYKELEG